MSQRVGWVSAFGAFLKSTSPVTYAVGATSFVAAFAFVAFDVIRTYEDSRAVELMARAVTTELVALSRDPAMAAITPVREASLVGSAASGVVVMPGREPSTTMTGIVQRGLVAFGGALLVTGFAWRRRPVVTGFSPYDDILASLPHGAACWSPEGELVACNDAYRLHLDPADPQIEQGATYNASIRRLVRGGIVRLVGDTDTCRIIELTRQDGYCLLIEDRPLPAGGFMSLVTDVTAQRKADQHLKAVQEEQRLLARRYHEEKLKAEAASRSKTAFLAHLSHDIRTPLNHIMGFAELIRQQTYGPLGNIRYIDYADTIKGSGEQLLAFFATILDLAELESGRRTLKQEPVAVDDMMDACVRKFRPLAVRAGLTLASGALCGATLTGDRFCLERMLGNLVDNAIRYTPARGRITLAAYAASDGVVLEITDTGLGMSQERLSALSQPFAFGDATFTKDHTGAGLGVPIARAIAEQSGGRLAIDSRLGMGTTVAVSLPIQVAEQSVAA